ncbi:MAG: hypothetical protein Q9164_005891, partial [Protoblastenia rupestris]
NAFDTIVEIIVGGERAHRKSFKVHKTLLCNVSAYFEAALGGIFKEGIEQKIELPEDDINTFTHFQYWLYTDTVLLARQDNDLKNRDIDWATLMRLYIFGQARQVPLLQNAVMDGFITLQEVKRWTPLDQIRLVYDETLEHSPLRRLYVDKTVNSARPDDPTWFSEATYDLFCPRFLFDVSKAYCERVAGKGEKITDFWAVRENYHV